MACVSADGTVSRESCRFSLFVFFFDLLDALKNKREKKLKNPRTGRPPPLPHPRQLAPRLHPREDPRGPEAGDEHSLQPEAVATRRRELLPIIKKRGEKK